VSGRLASFFAPVRAKTWWEFKTPVFLGVAYLSALVGGISFAEAWPAFLAVMLAIIPLASYVCVINDITDEGTDRQAGKSNTVAGKSVAFKASWLGACFLAGLIAAYFCFRGNTSALLLYAANWIAFALYSVPPFRLKERGVAGVVADACGGMVLPAFWSALLVDPSASAAFLSCLAMWALAFGLRGIIFHQLGDLGADRTAGVRTMAVRLGAANLRALVRFVLLPVELISLGSLLWWGGSMFAAPLLAAYVLLQFALWKWLRIRTVVAEPLPRSRIMLLKYYQIWFPLTSILALSLHDAKALLLIPLQALLFPGTWRRFGKHWSDIRHNLRYPPDWDRLTASTK
jgi:4-hydroxybenzoate polyprenyltransferase